MNITESTYTAITLQSRGRERMHTRREGASVQRCEILTAHSQLRPIFILRSGLWCAGVPVCCGVAQNHGRLPLIVRQLGPRFIVGCGLCFLTGIVVPRHLRVPQNRCGRLLADTTWRKLSITITSSQAVKQDQALMGLQAWISAVYCI